MWIKSQDRTQIINSKLLNNIYIEKGVKDDTKECTWSISTSTEKRSGSIGFFETEEAVKSEFENIERAIRIEQTFYEVSEGNK